MISYICLFLLLIVHGIREGFTWASPEERLTNIFITNRLGIGKAKIDYHGWRSIEYLLIWGMLGFHLWVLAIYMLAQLPYNCLLHKICGEGYLWYSREDFPWMGVTINKKWRTWRTDVALAFIGLAIFLGTLGV